MTSIPDLLAQLMQPVTAANEAEFEAKAIALGEMGEAALPAIHELQQSSDSDHRFWAVRSLWANGGQAAQEALQQLLTDPDEMVRSGAAMALGEMKAAAAVPALIQLLTTDTSAAGDHAADALGKIGGPAAEPLIALLADERTLLRLRAAKALIPIESHAAIRALIHCMDNDPSYLVRHYADVALKRMGVGEMIYFK